MSLTTKEAIPNNYETHGIKLDKVFWIDVLYKNKTSHYKDP